MMNIMSGSVSIQKIGITKLETDAIVNAANEELRAGGGVCGAIFEEAGYEQLTAACNAIGRCKTGSAVITPGFHLPARYIIHAVGPVWNGGNHNEPQLLYSAYMQTLILAKENDLHSIGFPLISAGIYGYPKDKAWRKALQACQNFLIDNQEYDMEIIFAVLEDSILQMGEEILKVLVTRNKYDDLKAQYGEASAYYAKIYIFSEMQKVLYKHPDELPGEYFESMEYIAKGMESLGFDMDCGEAIRKEFPDINVMGDAHILQSVIDQVTLQALGNAIYSQWRYWNHWAMGPMGDEDYEWFVTAFEGLAGLAQKEMK